MDHNVFYTGLVLRFWSGTVSLLSPQEGRIERKWYAPAHRSPLHRGSIVSYRSQNDTRNRQLTLENVELEQSATQLAFQDIYLLHYLLEACYYFIPIGSEAQHSFYYLVTLFNTFHLFPSTIQKKSVLCKLFALLGVYPDDVEIQLLVYQLRQMPIDNLVDGTLELDTELLMNRWLAWCMEVHPKGKFFKAMPLLLEK